MNDNPHAPHQAPLNDPLAGSTAHLPCCSCQRTIVIDTAVTCVKCKLKSCANCIMARVCMRCRNKTDDASPGTHNVRMTG